MIHWSHDIMTIEHNEDFPKYADIIAFSTFHWAVYMVNNKCEKLIRSS